VDKLPKVLEKKKSASTFMTIASIVQRRQADDFYMGTFKCEQEILLNSHPSDRLIQFIEHAIIEARPPTIVLRLIALQSLCCAKGLKTNVLQQYRKLFVDSYGIYELQWLLKLQMSGLIRSEGMDRRMDSRYPQTDYAALSRKYRLNVSGDELDEIKRSDTAYAYTGRASLLIRYLEEGMKNGWREFTKIEGTSSQKMMNPFENGKEEMNGKSVEKGRRTLIFAVGGLTRAEISCIKLLSEDLCVCSTAAITGDSLLNSFKN